jgi:glyoxylase-like metal-dependent hydrolase (beta-lactamase superfamily II)
MQIMTTGKVTDNFYILGSSTYPVYLLDLPDQPIIFESGIACAGEVYVEAIREVLGHRQPAFLFISHAHWDHAGSAAYLKQAFPAMRIAASSLAAEVLKRSGAVQVITQLNLDANDLVKWESGFDRTRLIKQPFQPFAIDWELRDGQVVEVDETTSIQVLATPGHTRDHLSYYLPRQKILVAVESGGYMSSSGKIEAEFVADYDGYITSLGRLAELPAEVLCQGHNLVFTGRDEIKEFFTSSMQEAVLYKYRICELLKEEKGNTDRVVQRMKAERYDNVDGFKQDEFVYTLNLAAQVKHIADKYF